MENAGCHDGMKSYIASYNLTGLFGAPFLKESFIKFHNTILKSIFLTSKTLNKIFINPLWSQLTQLFL